MKEINNPEDLGVDWKILLKWILWRKSVDQDKDQRQVLVKYLLVPIKKAENFLIRRGTNFSKYVHHGDS